MPDDLAEQIGKAMSGMHKLRDENASLREQLTACEYRRSMAESEVACLKAQLDGERAERRHYHSLANEIITRLDVVGRTVNDVVKRAQQEVYRQRKELTRTDTLPPIQIPEFLRQIAGEKAPEQAEATHGA